MLYSFLVYLFPWLYEQLGRKLGYNYRLYADKRVDMYGYIKCIITFAASVIDIALTNF